MKENYLAKWLNNELTDAELTEFKKTPEYASCQRIIEQAAALQQPDFDPEKALEEVQRQKEGPVRVIRLKSWKRFMRVAAAAAVLITVSLVYFNTLDEKVRTAYAERSEVSLPDASEVFLNAGSMITYDQKHWEKERTVTLKGEAFFKVARGRKFLVTTGQGQVAVLGTQFNVVDRKGYFSVSCYEGLVSVQFQGMEKQLPAGTSFLVIDGQVKETEAPEADMPSWISNESSFRSIPLAYVLDEFERQYDVDVETRNIDLEELFTGTFSNTNMDLALQSISTPSRISFKVEKDKVLFYAEVTP